MASRNLATDGERVACDNAIKAAVLGYLYEHPGRNLTAAVFAYVLKQLRPHHVVAERVRYDMLFSRMNVLLAQGAIRVGGVYEWVRLTASQWLTMTRQKQEYSDIYTEQ